MKETIISTKYYPQDTTVFDLQGIACIVPAGSTINVYLKREEKTMNKHDIQVGDYILKEDLVRDFDTFQAVVKAFEEAGFHRFSCVWPEEEDFEYLLSENRDSVIVVDTDGDFIGACWGDEGLSRKRNVEEFLPSPYKPDQNTVCEFSLNEQDWFSCRVKMYARDTKDNTHGVLLRTFLGEKHEQDQYFKLDDVSFRESKDNPHLKLADLGYKFSERCAIIKALGLSPQNVN